MTEQERQELAEQDREEWLRLTPRQMRAVIAFGWVPQSLECLEQTIRDALYLDGDDDNVAVYSSRYNGNRYHHTLRINDARLRLEMVDGPVNATYRVIEPEGIVELLRELDYIDQQDTIRSL